MVTLIPNFVAQQYNSKTKKVQLIQSKAKISFFLQIISKNKTPRISLMYIPN